MGANTIWAQGSYSFQLLQTLSLLGLKVCRPYVQTHVRRSLSCTRTPLPATAVLCWSPINVAATMVVTGLLSILVAMETLAILSQTSFSPGSIKHADFLLDHGASCATIPPYFRLNSNLLGQALHWKTLQTSFWSVSKYMRQPDHLSLRKWLTSYSCPQSSS